MPIGPLRGRSAAELVTRGRQALEAHAERLGVRPSAAPGARELARLLAPPLAADASYAERLHERLRATGGRRLVAGLTDRAATVATIAHVAPFATRSATTRADAILDGRFDLLGLRGLSFGEPVDWQFDPLAGRRAPAVHWSRVPYLDPQAVGDHKIVWELNRFPFLYTLGRAYWLTGDERYAARAVELIERWIDANPAKVGINWASSLELAFRSIAWVWALHFFRESPALSPAVVQRIYSTLYVHGRHLERHLSTWFSPNTHLTGEALGLLYLGTGLPEFRCATRWRRTGWAILERELDRQVTPDGVYFERASYYHRYTVDFYIHALLLVADASPASTERVRGQLGALLRHLQQITRGNGTFALFGDDDGGRLAHLDDLPTDDARPALSTGSALLHDPAIASSAGGIAEETVWLLGPDRAREWSTVAPRAPESLSAAYPEGGCCVLRDGWGPTASRLLLDCGPHGALSFGHSHDDALSIDVAVDGVSLLADPGTFSYVVPADRDYFRGARAHSTVLVAGEREPSAPAGPFRWNSAAHGRLGGWASGALLEVAEATRRTADDATVVRRDVAHVRGGYWVLADGSSGSAPAALELHFHGAAEVDAELAPGGATLRARAGAALRIAVAAPGARVAVEQGWTSRAYASRERCAHVVVSVGARDRVLTALLPTAAIAATVAAVPAAGGEAISVTTPEWDDLVLLGNGRAVGAGGVETDARWCWVRRDPVTRAVIAWAAVDVQRLAVDGATLHAGTTRCDQVESTSAPPTGGHALPDALGARERSRTATRN